MFIAQRTVKNRVTYLAVYGFTMKSAITAEFGLAEVFRSREAAMAEIKLVCNCGMRNVRREQFELIPFDF